MIFNIFLWSKIPTNVKEPTQSIRVVMRLVCESEEEERMWMCVCVCVCREGCECVCREG